jgi:4-aminobutyrate--pyruvate transaminase
MGCTPDTMTIAKAMSSGYAPISGVLIPQNIYDACVEASGELGVFGHGFTYSGHPLSTAISLKTLEIYEKRDVFGHVRRIAPLFARHIQALAQHPLVGDARSLGLIGGVQLVCDRDAHMPYGPGDGVGPYCAETAAPARGVLIRASNETLCFAPPLVITEDELDEMFARVKAALDDTLDWLAGHGKAPD